MENPWQTLDTSEKYSNPWISVQHNNVVNPSGNKGIYGVVHFKNLAVGIIPLDEEYNTWLVGQYRYPLNLYSWEIPEGGSPHDQDPIDGAKRELIEETGIEARKWTKILEMHVSNSVTDEASVIYVAQDLEFGTAEPEETEDLQIRKVPFQEVFEMVMNGEITDSLSMVGVMKVKLLMDSGKL